MMPDASIRPSQGRILAIALLGPLVGTLAIFLLPYIIDPPAGVSSESGAMVMLLFIFGYLFGILPSSLAAFVYSRAAPRLAGFRRRLFGCIAIGALCGMFGVIVPVTILAREINLDPSFMLLAAIAGAFALPLTALPFPPRH